MAISTKEKKAQASHEMSGQGKIRAHAAGIELSSELDNATSIGKIREITEKRLELPGVSEHLASSYKADGIQRARDLLEKKKESVDTETYFGASNFARAAAEFAEEIGLEKEAKRFHMDEVALRRTYYKNDRIYGKKVRAGGLRKTAELARHYGLSRLDVDADEIEEEAERLEEGR